MNSWALINIFAVFLFGSLFGCAELLQRYQAKYTFGEVMSWLYIILNGMVSVTALLLLKYFRGEAISDIKAIEIGYIVIAGFGGMMILRSSIYSIKHNDEKIDIGLATVFQIFLNAVEKKMKNKAAAQRIEDIEEIMQEVNFDLAKEELPILCIAFIENFSDTDSNNLNKKIEQISNLNISNKNKSLQLGRYIATYCDEEILISSIKMLPFIKNASSTSTNQNISQTDEEIESRILKLKKQ